MRKTVLFLFVSILVYTTTVAQNIQASLRLGASNEDVILFIRNGGTTTYTGNLTSFDITVATEDLNYRLRNMYFLFLDQQATYEYYTSFQRPHYHFNWVGNLAINLPVGATLDLVGFQMKYLYEIVRPAEVTLTAGNYQEHPWSVKINNTEVGDPVNRFFDSGIPDAYFVNHPFVSEYRIPIEFALPVKLAHFGVTAEGNSIKLNWITSEEVNASSFEVQHSIDSKDWGKIGSIAANGESSATNHYSFNHHPGTSGNNYYRLKMIDTDLTYAFSKIEVVDIQNSSAAIYPNPVENYLSLEGIDMRNATSVKIYNTLGRLVKQYESLKSPVSVEQLLPGNYIAIIQNRDGSLVNHKFMKR